MPLTETISGAEISIGARALLLAFDPKSEPGENGVLNRFLAPALFPLGEDDGLGRRIGSPKPEDVISGVRSVR